MLPIDSIMEYIEENKKHELYMLFEENHQKAYNYFFENYAFCNNLHKKTGDVCAFWENRLLST